MTNLTSEQIKAARLALGWGLWRLAKKASLPISAVERAESADGALKITSLQHARLRQALEAAGIEFITEPPGIRFECPVPRTHNAGSLRCEAKTEE